MTEDRNDPLPSVTINAFRFLVLSLFYPTALQKMKEGPTHSSHLLSTRLLAVLLPSHFVSIH